MTQPLSPSPITARYRVLVVDDQPEIRELVSVILCRCFTADCEVATCVAEALDRLQYNEYHALLTDMVMPGGSGMELLLAARKMYPNLVCGVMTGYSEVLGSAEIPADFFYLSKPFTRDTLVKEVRQAIERTHQN